jgi:eukaryotic-like serine/threonine-protein kinase
VQKLDTPLAQATTPSLEALKAYSSGGKAWNTTGERAAIPFYKRAIELDPNFAMAYVALGVGYSNLGEIGLAAQNTRKAYQLRERVSEREKSDIECLYYQFVTGDLAKARQAYELWAQTYPREYLPPNNLSVIYREFGQYDKTLAEIRKAHALDALGSTYPNLVRSYIYLNRLEDARTVADEAQAKKFDSDALRTVLYGLAFLQNDVAGMGQQAAWLADKPGSEDWLLAMEADTTAYSGRLARARDFSRRAVASAERVEEKEGVADWEADAAMREALFGNAAEARQRASAALALSRGRDAQYVAALALATAGNAARAQALADDFSKRFPEDTIVRFNYLPTLQAQLALRRNDDSNAIEALQAAVPYELGLSGGLYPIYVRGEGYLAAHQGNEAAAEFQKILDHRGIVLNSPIGALAHLQIGRAYAMQGDAAKASLAYQDFLTLWKDADPDIPILQQAKSEYAKLQ